MECYGLLIDAINQRLSLNTEKQKGAGLCMIVIHF
jgi:hypothetical protein